MMASKTAPNLPAFTLNTILQGVATATTQLLTDVNMGGLTILSSTTDALGVITQGGGGINLPSGSLNFYKDKGGYILFPDSTKQYTASVATPTGSIAMFPFSSKTITGYIQSLQLILPCML